MNTHGQIINLLKEKKFKIAQLSKINRKENIKIIDIKKDEMLKKKVIIIFTLIGLFSVSFRIVLAESTDDYSSTTTIDELYNQYLENHNAQGREDLTVDENNELSDLIQNFKEINYNSFPRPMTRARLNAYTGGIFVHYDSRSGSWAHGHAGIGYYSGTIEILNCDDVVKYHGPSRIDEWYDKKTGGFFTVQGATEDDNTRAGNNAQQESGKGYWIIGDTGDFGGYTCSYLVAYAWNKAGIYLGGRLVTPTDLENHSKTIKQFSWVDVE